MACLIDAGVLIDCQDLPKGGAKNYALVYNYTEWADMVADGVSITYDADGAITAIANPSGVAAFRFDVPDNSSLQVGNPIRAIEGGFDSYDHTVNFTVSASTQIAKNTVSKMRLNKVVAILYKNDGLGEVYGSDQGLKLITDNTSTTNADTGGIQPIELATDPSGPAESNKPANIDAGTLPATKILMDALVVAGV